MRAPILSPYSPLEMFRIVLRVLMQIEGDRSGGKDRDNENSYESYLCNAFGTTTGNTKKRALGLILDLLGTAEDVINKNI